jgi:hypothetical protein
MIKLFDILKEIYLLEGIIKVPQEVLSKSKEAFDYINSNLNNLKSKSKGKNYKNPYIDSKFKNFFKLKDLKNQDLNVTIGFYNDPEDLGAGRMDTEKDILLINLPFFVGEDYDDFEDTVEHELVHAMDPKVRDIQLFGKLYSKKGVEPINDKTMEKYLKSPWEFDAFTAPLINKIVNNIKKSPSYKDVLIKLLSDIKSKDIDTILSSPEYDQMPYFFTKKEWKVENWDYILNEFKNELYKIKAWASKPTLYKRFTSRLGKELI